MRKTTVGCCSGGGKVLMSEHVKCMAAARIAAGDAADALEKNLQRFGSTLCFRLKDLQTAKRHLSPLKSFTTRFVILGYHDWSLVLSDMRYEHCSADALQLSRDKRCDAVALSYRDNDRYFSVFKSGEKLREIQVILDGDRWHFREYGRRQSFEDSLDSAAPPDQRLTPQGIVRCFAKVTGLLIPKWTEGSFQDCFALERSVTDLAVPVVQFPTEDDLPIHRSETD